jgi:hypothetical protein
MIGQPPALGAAFADGVAALKTPRQLLVDPDDPRSLSARARRARWERFTTEFPDLPQLRVLDLGGTPQFWRQAPVRPLSVTTVNLSADRASEPWITTIVGDACEYDDSGFDLVVSNSLLEHVGGAARRQQLAEVIRRSAARCWVQTPYRYFPLEPHWLFPGFQWLPLPARVAVTRHWRYGHRHQVDPKRALELVLEVELVGITEMRSLFPDARLWLERAGGLVKSLVAIR